jgi:predicted kinase
MIVTIGIPASGKTTWAESQDLPIVERDMIREELFGFPYKFSRSKEKQVTKIQEERIRQYKGNCIVSDTNINPGTRERLKLIATELGAEYTEKLFPIEYEEAVRQDLKRTRSVGSNVIWDKFKQYNQQFGIKPVEQDAHLPGCYIFDIDGTLAVMKNRTPFCWHKVGDDLLNTDVARILGLIQQSGFKVFIFSGRDEICKKQTEEWLQQHGFGDIPLFMRPQGSYAKDFDVKHQMYKNHIQGKYKVLGIFDDRPQVCRLWNLLGLPLFKLGDQHEF